MSWTQRMTTDRNGFIELAIEVKSKVENSTKIREFAHLKSYNNVLDIH